MVKYKTLVRTIEDYVAKCDDYPKAQALNNFNRDDYQEEIKGNFVFDPGQLETLQRNLQKEVEYDGLEKGIVRAYNITSFSALQKYLNNEPFDEEDGARKLKNGNIGINVGYSTYDLVDDGEGHMVAENYEFHMEEVSMKNFADTLHQVCEKSPPLQQNTVLYRYGRIPNDVIEGGHGTFKGFIGACYGEGSLDGITDQLTQWADPTTRYKLKIYAPKGTKGVAITHECGAENPYQNEFLIDKGQKFIVLSRNDETKEAEILLY